MTESSQIDSWNHTAQLLALTANCHRDPKKRNRPFQPRDFHPLLLVRRKPPEPMPMGKWSELKKQLKRERQRV